MTITTSDVLQSFLTAIKDLHSTILHMILKLLFQELRIEKILVFIILVFKSCREVANFGFNFSANFSCNQNNKTTQRILNLLNLKSPCKSQLSRESSKRNCLCQKMGRVFVFETHCLKRRHASRRPSQLDFKTN